MIDLLTFRFKLHAASKGNKDTLMLKSVQDHETLRRCYDRSSRFSREVPVERMSGVRHAERRESLIDLSMCDKESRT